MHPHLSAAAKAIIAFGVALVFVLFVWNSRSQSPLSQTASSTSQSVSILTSDEAPPPEDASDPWLYTFNATGTLYEAASPEESSSQSWWLDSGGKLEIGHDIGQTIEGALPAEDDWYKLYAQDNALDTDGGRFPQNLFRLISRFPIGDADVSVKFRIDAVHMTVTPNRGEWSGVFIMNRYIDSDNLYYAGIRQDGHAVIKKKRHGVYYTLAETPLWTDGEAYDSDTNPNLIPGKKWMRMMFRTEETRGGVALSFYIDEDGTGEWKKILTAQDNGAGDTPITGPGHIGLRADYMDVSFDDIGIIATTEKTS